MNSVETGLATVGRVESKIHLVIFGFIGIALIGLGFTTLIEEHRSSQNKPLQENKAKSYHPYVLIFVGLMFIMTAYGNYYLTQKSTTYAAFEGAEDVARLL